MKSSIASLLLGIGLLLGLGGCAHVEIPFPGQTSSGKHRGDDTSRVDVQGVGDGVASQRVIVKRIAFPADEYSQLKSMGNGTVKGTIYIRYNGKQINGRQTRLYLNPVTSYSNQWYRESYLGGHKMGKSDPRLFNYLKFTASNNNGEFAFYGVPAGSYYVVGTVKCDACGGKNIRIAKKVRVGSAGTVTINLSKTI
jgi:hypothetical protein